MNTIKKLALIALAMITYNASAQTDKATTNKIVEEKNYIFVATSAIPLSNMDVNRVLSGMPGANAGGVINLTGSNYDLRIVPDSVIAYLPFYGRAYRAPMNNDESGHKFTSKDFTYTKTKRKKGGWDVNINTNDVKDNVRMTLNITESGYGTLVVISNNKQSITYNGYISEAKKPL